MLASKTSDVINGENSSSPALGCSASVPCSICFDLVIDDGERSIAKLQCGHKFHLDCIGSAFNTKGTMQCPNCRKVESGRWLFAEGSAHAISATGTQDWVPTIGPHDLSYYRRPLGFHWCPFSGFTLHASFEEAESSLNRSSNFHGNHARPSSAHSYISYFRPSDHFGNSNFHHPLNSISALHLNNIPNPSWGWICHFLPYNADRDYIDHSRAHADALARPPSFRPPLHYTQHRPISRTGASSAANSQSRERTQILHTSYQENPSEIATNGFGRFGNVRGLPMIPPPPSRPHHHGGHAHGFYIRETERDESPMIWGSFHHRLSTNRTH